jgi:RNA ligase
MYDEEGREPLYPLLSVVAGQLGWRLAERHDFASLADLVTHTSTLPATAEGFVLRFTDGTRLKIKGEEYRRIHALISRCTPLAMWEAMEAGDNLEAIRDQLPDEFLGDFDAIIACLDAKVTTLVSDVAREAAPVAAWSDKEVGLALTRWSEPIRSFIFPYRKNGGDLLSGRARKALFRAIRPTGNILAGYTPSYAMNRVAEEAL